MTIAEMLTQAFGHHQAGRLAEAEPLYRAILQADPHHIDALQLLGIVLATTGRSEEAVEYFREVLRIKPDFAEVHNHLGNALKVLGKHSERIACHQEAARLKPDFAEAHANLGNAFKDLNRLEEAIVCYRTAIRLKPGFAEAHTILGNALKDLGQPEEAAACHREAIRLRPDLAEAHNNLGAALKDLGRPEEAAAAYREAIRLKPDFAEAFNNLGVAQRDLGKLEEAVSSSQAALRLDPGNTEAHFNLGLVYLQLGNYERGWREYEWRWRSKAFATPALPTSKPIWDGSPLAGRIIFLYAEQGLGDTIWFIRYAPRVKALGGRVILGCQQPLTRLLQGCAGIDQVVAYVSELPPFDVCAPLLSLPQIFGTTLPSLPADVPYLSADLKLVKAWRKEIGGGSFKVGIAWQGSPTYGRDRHRSIPLEHFTALASVPGVQFFSLQKHYGLEQLPGVAGRLPLIDLGSRLDVAAGPFMDTAAVMMNLDLVIAPDTAIAPLAGALGVPVWVALSSAPYWAWLMEREDSPWFPTARLFRQKEPGKWAEVFERMARELEKAVRR